MVVSNYHLTWVSVYVLQFQNHSKCIICLEGTNRTQELIFASWMDNLCDKLIPKTAKNISIWLYFPVVLFTAELVHHSSFWKVSMALAQRSRHVLMESFFLILQKMNLRDNSEQQTELFMAEWKEIMI